MLYIRLKNVGMEWFKNVKKNIFDEEAMLKTQKDICTQKTETK